MRKLLSKLICVIGFSQIFSSVAAVEHHVNDGNIITESVFHERIVDSTHIINDDSITIRESGTYYLITGNGEATPNTITVDSDVVVFITLKNVNIDGNDAFKLEPRSTVYLDIQETNSINSKNQAAGITVPELASLEISGDGSLFVTGGTNHSGIGVGGQDGTPTGFITINSGTIQAFGNSYSSGIGGSGSIITINGGRVTATGSGGGTGIGEPYTPTLSGNSTVTTVTINGGIVTATGSGDAPGIGGGNNSTVTINSGTVTATGSGDAPGIGGHNSNTLVKINGGNVKGSVYPQPTDNTNTTAVYCLKVSFDSVFEKNIPVMDIFVEKEDRIIKYSVNDVAIHDDGKFYFWLPEGFYDVVAMQIDTIFYMNVDIPVPDSATCTLSNYLEGNDDFNRGEGNLGDLTWKFSDGVLTVSGQGDMPEGLSQPWYEFGTSIRKVVIEEGVTSIGSDNFNNTINLASVTLPQSLTSIEPRAFESCYALKSVVIPPAVASIGGLAFSKCVNLTSITNRRPNPQPLADGDDYSFKNTDVKKITLLVPGRSVEKYAVAEGWHDFGTIGAFADSVDINKTTAGSVIGGSSQLSATVFPDNALNKDVKWSSSNPEVAKVDSTGKITAMSPGKAIITAATFNGYASTDCEFYVVTMKSIFVTDGKNKFDAKQVNDTAYSMEVPYLVKEVTVWPILNYSSTTEIKSDLVIGDNNLTIAVRVFNTEKIYTLNIRRLKNDAALSKLTVSAGILTPEFDSNTFNYTDTVEHSINAFSFDSIEARDGDAKIHIQGNGEYLREGNNLFSITVTSEDKTEEREYTVDVFRKSNSSGTGISNTGTPDVQVYMNSQTLYINTPVSERIAIYSATGKLLYRLEKPAGKTSFASTGRASGQVLIVRGSSGWAKKLIH
jgi:hypothetical protein